MLDTVLFAVNGTLMRGLDLKNNLTGISATFVKESRTRASYKLFSINDEHPAMYRVSKGGVKVSLEIWKVPTEGLVSILQNEPSGLAIGTVILEDNSHILGVLGERILCEGQLEISDFGDWRSYIKQKT
ncbi:hypothetical protein SAMN04488113_1595 [Alkalibacterium gilvum]|uniref:Allophanate hydrolase C-terminal domain-containing protein n=1 Tax=Alkalibacterium gilvum TaxID=1130080 RepID=A0A1H6VN70_9LACT|nr:glutamyl-tRNA amidotransferase [Alkalibacterium gilvum]SEJ05136.1 hypothetical protein SAMN04488113_1595 [Alkalibacterium gilvum]